MWDAKNQADGCISLVIVCVCVYVHVLVRVCVHECIHVAVGSFSEHVGDFLAVVNSSTLLTWNEFTHSFF